MCNLQTTANRIKELCDKNNISINKMLTESGAGARTYHNILAGSHPSTDKASKIADYFNVSVDYLLGRTDNPEVNRSAEKHTLAEYSEIAALGGSMTRDALIDEDDFDTTLPKK